jgi:hypothetical protein
MKLKENSSSKNIGGFNVETFIGDGTNIEIWDVSSEHKPELWYHYYQEADGIAFFLDLSRNDEPYYK